MCEEKMTNGSAFPDSGLKVILTLTAVVLAVLGSGLLLVPNVVAALYGAAVSLDGTNAARTAGAAIFALGLLDWLSKRQEAGATTAVGVPVLFVWFLLKSVVAYLGVRNRVFDPFVGGTILFFDVLLAVIYGYYVFSMVLRAPRKQSE
jgi:hypothetical protein